MVARCHWTHRDVPIVFTNITSAPAGLATGGQSIQRYQLTMNELLPRHERMSLAGMFSNGSEFSIRELIETLERHMGWRQEKERGNSFENGAQGGTYHSS